MMLHGKLRRARLRKPPLVPMINIVFLLLLYFMLVGTLNEKRLAILPPVSESEELLKPDFVLITANRAGQLTLQDDVIKRGALVAAFSALNGNLDRNGVLQFAADRNTPSEVLLDVLAAAQTARFEEVQILTRLEPKRRSGLP